MPSVAMKSGISSQIGHFLFSYLVYRRESSQAFQSCRYFTHAYISVISMQMKIWNVSNAPPVPLMFLSTLDLSPTPKENHSSESDQHWLVLTLLGLRMNESPRRRWLWCLAFFSEPNFCEIRSHWSIFQYFVLFITMSFSTVWICYY